MNAIDVSAFNAEVKGLIRIYNEAVLADLKKIKLKSLLKKKNTLLAASEPIETAFDYAKWCLDNWLFSSKESKFGHVLERMAFYVANVNLQILPYTLTGIDLVVGNNNYLDLVQIKSGPNWGNSDQKHQMIENMKNAELIIQNDLDGREVRFINLVCYGTDGPSNKGDYLKFCGQECWNYLTEDSSFYLKIIEPIRCARDYASFENEYNKTLNLLTKEATNLLLSADGSINWEALQKLNSGKKNRITK